MTSDQIRAYLSFYEDLGVTEVYRRTAELAPLRLEIPTSAPITHARRYRSTLARS